MEIDLGPSARAFRDELRGWLEANRPEELLGVDTERAQLMGGTPAVRAWLDKLREAGYVCVSWPKEYGGRGLSGVEVAVMNVSVKCELPVICRIGRSSKPLDEPSSRNIGVRT